MKVRIVERHVYCGNIVYVIQCLRWKFWWVDASMTTMPGDYDKDTYLSLSEAKDNVKWFDGSVPRDRVICEW